MGTLFDTFGNMQSGALIRAADWNGLVQAIDTQFEGLSGDIRELKEDLEGDIQDLRDDLDEILESYVTKTDFQNFQDQVNSVFRGQYRLALKTSSSEFALGQIAEIEAQVTTLLGENVTNRPWVDFVATWGTLKAAPGFNSLASTGERAISVQTDANGLCKVRLCAEVVASLNAAEADSVNDYMEAVISVGDNQSSAGYFIASPSPEDARAKAAYAAATATYNDKSAGGFRKFIDNYYVAEASNIAGKYTSGSILDWKDYPCTLVAIVKNDINPLTPDHGRGASSIQVTFRDWIWHWIKKDYLSFDKAEILEKAVELKGMLKEKYTDTVKGWNEYVSKNTYDAGVLEKQRQRILTYEAMENVRVAPPSKPPEYMNGLLDTAQNTLLVQQVLEVANLATPFSTAQQAFADTSAGVGFAGSTGVSAEVDERMKGIEIKAAEVEGTLGKLSSDFQTFGNQLQGLDQTTAGLSGGLAKFEKALGSMDVKVQGITTLQSELAGVKQQTLQLNTDFGQYKTQLGRVQDNLGVLSGRVDSAISETGVLGGIQAKVDTLNGQVLALKNIDPTRVVSMGGDLLALDTRLKALEGL